MPSTMPANRWVNISDKVIDGITATGAKIPWPAQTSGVACDRITGQLYMVVGGVGLFTSHDRGESFTRIGQGYISGRCEFGYALNADPAGNRLACFMLDGKSGMTLDAGKTWHSLEDVARNWDFGAVDWTDANAANVLAAHHESGGEMYCSNDSGRSWAFTGRHSEFWHGIGILDSRTLVAGKSDGIYRSSDAGQSWNKVSDLHPTGRVAVAFKGLTYWLGKEGLLTTADLGLTWQVIGNPTGAGWGPFFGKDPSDIIVGDSTGILRSTDSGHTWTRIVSTMPPVEHFSPRELGRFRSIAYDPNAHLLYTSCMANPTYRWQMD